MTHTRDQIFTILHEVKDPEVPVLDIVEMGIVRDVEPDGDAWRIDITPTYSGCPAMRAIEDEIGARLRAHGIARFRVATVFRAAWTTDWMTDDAKEKLRAYGIAPPVRTPTAHPLAALQPQAAVACPFCGSSFTELKSQFGSTACKSLHFCASCQQPFEHFKCV